MVISTENEIDNLYYGQDCLHLLCVNALEKTYPLYLLLFQQNDFLLLAYHEVGWTKEDTPP